MAVRLAAKSSTAVLLVIIENNPKHYRASDEVNTYQASIYRKVINHRYRRRASHQITHVPIRSSIY